jgi:hypothetical protein
MFLLPALLLVGALVLLFLWSTRPRRKSRALLNEPASVEQMERRHVTHCSQIRQALSREDFDYLVAAGRADLARRVRKERLRIARSYVAALRGDFYRLVRLGKIIAKLSPQVVALKEAERLTLTAQFLWRCRLIEARLLLGMAPLKHVVGVSELVGLLGVRIEAALKELGERAALAVEMASSVDRRLNTV